MALNTKRLTVAFILISTAFINLIFVFKQFAVIFWGLAVLSLLLAGGLAGKRYYQEEGHRLTLSRSPLLIVLIIAVALVFTVIALFFFLASKPL
jgi:hypothetical protein